MSNRFIESVEELEERVKRELGNLVLMRLYIEDCAKKHLEVYIMKEMYKAQVTIIVGVIADIEFEKDMIKKKAYEEGISYVDVQDTLSIVTRGLEYLQKEKKRYRELEEGVE